MTRCIRRFSIVLLSVLLLAFVVVRIGLAQEGSWSDPINISNTPNNSWFPDLAVDSQGNVHVIWCETSDLEGGRRQREQVFYSVWDGQSWSDPNDIVPPSPNIHRNAMYVDRTDVIHALFGGSPYGSGMSLYYQSAHSAGAWSAAAWSIPHRISPEGSYMGDIAVDSQGTVHVIYDGPAGYAEEGSDVEWSDIFYRHSADSGRTWSYPVNLSPSASTGSSRAQMDIDSSDTIHISWDEGWDRLSGQGGPVYSAYTSSSDGGHMWSPVITVTYPVSTVAQLAVSSDGDGGVMLVWRVVPHSQENPHDEIFYQWSTDGGRSWEAPSVIPGVFSRPWANPFDMYAMATDSAGHIHLVVVGRQFLGTDAPLGVYHLEWDGGAWSNVERIYGGPGFPEYPRITISQGNRLHVVWFVRASLWHSEDEDPGPHQVWYSSSQSAAPRLAVASLPTSTPVPPTPTPRPTPTATAYPTVSFENTGLPDGLDTESDEVFQLAIALLPVALLILGVMVALRMERFGKTWL